MKKILVLVFMILCTVSLYSESDKQPMVRDYKALLKCVKYPERALKLGIEGRVIVAVYIDSLGIPIKTKIMESKNPIFDQAAVEAVMQYKGFIPAMIDSVPVSCWLQIPINFKIRNNESNYNKYEDIDYNKDELDQNILKAQKEFKYFNEAFVKTEVDIDKNGDITNIIPFECEDTTVIKIITQAIRNTKYLQALFGGKVTDGFINLYISLSVPTENFDFDFDGKPYTMNVINEEPHSSKCYTDLESGSGEKIKNLDTVKIQCSVFDYKQKLKSREEFKSIIGIGEINQYLEQFILDMQAGGEKLVWLTEYSMYKKGKKVFPKDLFVPEDENVFITIKVLEINPK